MDKLLIRNANLDDTKSLLTLIKGLAEYEKRSQDVKVTNDDLVKGLEKGYFDALLIYYENNIAGYAIYYYNYSSFLGKRGLYLEDIYLKKEFRDLGLGKKVISHLAKIALDSDCNKIDFSCLTWNEPSLKFYEALKAKQVTDWYSLTLPINQLKELIK